MSSVISTVSNFEELPDELILLICRYLSSTDILFSFYNLNSRLSQTISGFYQHVVLGQVSFKQFNYICQSILPNISINIYTLVVSNDWKGVLSKIFLNHIGDKMSLLFPNLRYLILATFRMSSLLLFLDCLHDLPELFEIKIMSLYEMGTNSIEPQSLLERIFTSNNNRLTSILFDDDSLSFSYKNKTSINYSNIEKLIIELTTQNDFHRLLTYLPQIKYLDVTINNKFSKSDKEIELNSILTLKYFRLQSFTHFWKFNEITRILKRLPNIEELIIEISIDSNNTDLINGEEMFYHLSSLSLKKFRYFFQFENSSSFNHTNILSIWQQFNQEFVYIQNDDNNTFIFYTLPFDIINLTLQYQIAKNKIFLDNYSLYVQNLTLFDVSKRIIEIFPILNKCRQIQRLVLRINEKIVSQSVQQIQLYCLPYLTFFVALEKSSVDIDDFKKLLQVSPNLYHLAVNYEFLKPLFDNESICYLLEHRITHLLIGISWETDLQIVIDSISRLSIIFPFLRHLYFHIQSNRQTSESLILMIFNQLCQWNFLVSFGIANAKIDEQILTKGIREWVIENSLLNDNDLFHTDYSDNTFRLWF